MARSAAKRGMILWALAAAAVWGAAMAMPAKAASSAALDAFAEARTAADQISKTYKKDRLLGWLAEAQAEAGDPAALQTAKAITEPQDRNWALSEMAVGWVAEGKADAALQAAAAVPAGQDRDQIYRRMALEQTKAGDVDGAKRTVDRIQSPEARTTAMADVARVQATAGNIDQARQTLAGLAVTASQQAWVLSGIAEAQAEASEMAAAIATAKTVLQLMEQTTDEGEKAAVAQHAVIALVAVGQLDRALAISNDLPAGTEKANALTACARAQLQQGELVEALATALSIGETLGVESAMRSLMHARLSAGNYVDATNIATLMPRDTSQFRALHTVIEHQAEAGEIDSAQANLVRLGKGALAFLPLSQSLADIAVAQARAGHPEEAGKSLARAWATAQMMDARHQRERAVAYVIEALAKAGDAEVARQLAASQPSALDRAAGFVGLGRGLENRLSLQTPMAIDLETLTAPPSHGSTLVGYLALPARQQNELLEAKVDRVLEMLKSPTFQGQAKPEAMREAHLEAYTTLHRHFTQPYSGIKNDPYFKLGSAINAHCRQRDAHAELDQVILSYIDRLHQELAHAEQAPAPSKTPSP